MSKRPDYEPRWGSQQWLRWHIWAKSKRPDFWYASDDEVALFKEWKRRYADRQVREDPIQHED